MKTSYGVAGLALLSVVTFVAFRFEPPAIGSLPEVAVMASNDASDSASVVGGITPFAGAQRDCQLGVCDQPTDSTFHETGHGGEVYRRSRNQNAVGVGAGLVVPGNRQDGARNPTRASLPNADARGGRSASLSENESSSSGGLAGEPTSPEPPAVEGVKTAQLIVFVTPSEAIYFGNTCATLGQQLQRALQQLLVDAEWAVPEADIGPPSYEVIFLRERHDTSVFMGPDWVASGGLLAAVDSARLRGIIEIAMVRSGSGSAPSAVADYRARVFQYGVPGGSDPDNCPR